ncbi:MAG: tyrosine-type recombinase/integrase [Blastocatellia bacterium]
MSYKFPAEDVNWKKFPRAAACPLAKSWLTIQANFGLAPNTIDAYARGLDIYLQFCESNCIAIEATTRAHVAAYIRHLLSSKKAHNQSQVQVASDATLSNATLQQRLTALRLFFGYLVEEGIQVYNPVGRGCYGRANLSGIGAERGLIPRYRKLPWIPSDAQWDAILEAACQEPVRNRLMLALSYDSALRREELCSLETKDIDPSHRMIRIRAETTKNRQERIVPYSIVSNELYMSYLEQRRKISQRRGPLFLSESRRNKAEPVSVWTWSKAISGIAARAGVKQFTTHTLRHLCLTDLARANWDIHEIATFAGHRSIQTTLLYIHLSGRDLAHKLEQGMAQIHAWRISKIGASLR